jgi:hypothetical protein
MRRRPKSVRGSGGAIFPLGAVSRRAGEGLKRG